MKNDKDYLSLAKKLTRSAFYYEAISNLESETKFEAMHHSVSYKPDGEIVVSLNSEKPDCHITIKIDADLDKEALLTLLKLLHHRIELEFDEWQ